MLSRKETGGLYEAFIEDIPLCCFITKRDALRSYLIILIQYYQFQIIMYRFQAW